MKSKKILLKWQYECLCNCKYTDKMKVSTDEFKIENAEEMENKSWRNKILL